MWPNISPQSVECTQVLPTPHSPTFIDPTGSKSEISILHRTGPSAPWERAWVSLTQVPSELGSKHMFGSHVVKNGWMDGWMDLTACTATARTKANDQNQWIKHSTQRRYEWRA